MDRLQVVVAPAVDAADHRAVVLDRVGWAAAVDAEARAEWAGMPPQVTNTR